MKVVLLAAPTPVEVLTRRGAICLDSVFVMAEGALIRQPKQDIPIIRDKLVLMYHLACRREASGLSIVPLEECYHILYLKS